MGAKFSMLTDSIARRRGRSSSTVSTQTAFQTHNGNIETGHDPAIHGALLEDRNYNNEAYKKKPADPHDAQKRSTAAITIQQQFRQQTSKGEVDEMRTEDAAIKIQAGFRGFISRQQVRQMKENDDKKPEEEDIDVDLTAPEVEQAAIKIQAGFKGFKARKELLEAKNIPHEGLHKEPHSDQEEDDNPELPSPETHLAATKIQAGFRGHNTRKHLQKQGLHKEPHSDQEEDDNPELPSPETHLAATKIQAGFRGHNTRKHLQKQKKDQEDKSKQDDDLDDIDLKDPDLSKAALKIQAGFRGLKSRKELQMKKDLRKEEETEEPKVEEEEVDIDLNDPEVEKAALKLQAGFKGLKARKDLRKKTEEKQREEEEEVPVKNFDLDLDEPEVDRAAQKIQASYRGYATRKHLTKTPIQQMPQPSDENDDDDKNKILPAGDDEEVDIDLTDPEVEKATIKLQAGFKGFKARKQAQAQELAKQVDEDQGMRNDDPHKAAVLADEMAGRKSLGEFDRDHLDLEKEKAASKIQAGFRGMKTRNELNTVQESKKLSEQASEEKEEAEEAEDAEEENQHLFEEEPDEM